MRDILWYQKLKYEENHYWRRNVLFILTIALNRFNRPSSPIYPYHIDATRNMSSSWLIGTKTCQPIPGVAC